MACDSTDPGIQILNDDELIISEREENVEEEDNLKCQSRSRHGTIS